VELTVQRLHEGCNDYGGADEERPRSDVPVYFTQQDTETMVGTMSAAGERYRATLRFEVPLTARPGSAVLHLGPEHNPIGTFIVE
jgi:hypothetical protein